MGSQETGNGGEQPAGLRLAPVDDATEVARLLHDFNTEFQTPTPGVEVLTRRLRTLLADDQTFAILYGSPPVAIALATLRTNVWYDGHVALLDELYVQPGHRNCGIGSKMIEFLLGTTKSRGMAAIEINVDEGDVDAQRFYERHGFTSTDPGSSERAFYYWQETS